MSRSIQVNRMTTLVLTLAMSFFWGCSPHISFPALGPDIEGEGEYQLDSGDQVRVHVFGQEELSGTYTVDGTGMISMPLLRTMTARGSTTAQLELAITERLEKGILRSPSVSVQIESFRPFFILGQVRNPGNYPYVHRMTVLTAVAVGGGFTPRAEQGYVSITRTVGDRPVEGRAERSTLVYPGDVIFVHERFF